MKIDKYYKPLISIKGGLKMKRKNNIVKLKDFKEKKRGRKPIPLIEHCRNIICDHPELTFKGVVTALGEKAFKNGEIRGSLYNVYVGTHQTINILTEKGKLIKIEGLKKVA